MQGERYTDMSIRLSTLCMKYVGLWVAKDHAEQRRRTLAIAYTVFVTFVSTFVEFRDFYLSWGNLNTVLYVSCNILCIVLVELKVYVILAHKVDFINLILYVQEHFWNRSYDIQEKAILADCRKICIFFTVSVTFIGECSVVAYIVTPLVANIGKNESDRQLPFNLWVGKQAMLTPYYEMLFVFEIFMLYHVGVCYFSFDNLFCILSLHISTQFRLLQHRFTRLCDTYQEVNQKNVKLTSICCDKLKCYIQQHQNLIDLCDTLERVYTLIILGQVVVFSVLICLFGYQIILANASLARRSVFVLLITGSICMLYMFTYSCQGLIEHSELMANAAYSAMWTQLPMNKFSKSLRNDLVMIILRSRRVCCVTANGFFSVSLETFTKILSTAASYFTLLRNNIEYGDTDID